MSPIRNTGQMYIFSLFSGDQEQVHRSGGGLRVRQLLQRSAGADGYAPAQRQDHAILPATNQVFIPSYFSEMC
jgi:hypothetical protein